MTIKQSMISISLIALLLGCGGGSSSSGGSENTPDKPNSEIGNGDNTAPETTNPETTNPETTNPETTNPETTSSEIVRRWSTVTLLEHESGDVTTPSVDMNNFGTSVVAWAQKDGTNVNAKIAYSTSYNEWTTSVLNSPTTNVDFVLANLIYTSYSAITAKINDSGLALAAWSFEEKENSNLKGVAVSQFNAMTKEWAEQTVISRSNNNIHGSVQLVLNESGQGAVVWAQESDTNKAIYMSTYSDEIKAWSEPIAIATGDVYSPQVVLSTTGEATIVFEKKTGTNTSQLNSVFVDAIGQVSSVQRVDNQTTSVAEYTLTINKDNKKILIWAQQADSNGQKDPWLALSSGETWGDALQIDSTHGRVIAPLATYIGDTDNLLLIWIDPTSSANKFLHRSLFSATFSANGALSAITTVQNGYSYIPSISNPENGSIWGAWGQVTVSEYKDGHWNKEPQFSTIPRAGVKIAAASNGEAIAVWISKKDGAFNLSYSKRQ